MSKRIPFSFSGLFSFKRLFLLLGVLAGGAQAYFGASHPALSELSIGFAHSFPSPFTLRAFAQALLLQGLPLLLIWFSGFLIVSRVFCTALITLRALLSGYICVSFFIASTQRDGVFAVIFLLFVFFEALTLALMNSMGRLAGLFFDFYVKKRQRSALVAYTRDQAFFCGLALAVYLMRGTVVLLFGP